MKTNLPERMFAFAVRNLCQTLDTKAGVSRTLNHQLLRAGTSIGANVEEGQASQSRSDFTAKYSIACKEARETPLLAALACCNGDSANQSTSVHYRWMQ